MNNIKNLGLITNAEVINQFVNLNDRFVIDVGCGGMDFSRILTGLDARVLAIDPDPIQAELNRKAELGPGLEFVEAGADQLPVERGTVDGVFFSYSLHHIPAAFYPKVFDEVLRVLKPTGFLYVIEPTGCPLNDVMKLFHDEDSVRAAAQQALQELAAPAFDSVEIVNYHSIREFDSYEDFAQRFSSRTFNPGYTEADVRRPEVKETFERLGAPDYRFEAPKQVMYLQGPRIESV